MRGALRGSGDTSWPLYGKALALAARLSVVSLSLPVGFAIGVGGLSVTLGLGLGTGAVYAAILVDFYIQAVVNVARFWSGKWRLIARRTGIGVAGQE